MSVPTTPRLDAGVRATLEDALAGWLPIQRWFSGKDRPILSVHVLADTPLSTEGAVAELHHLVVAVAQAGSTDVYQVPVSLRHELDDRLEHALIVEVDGRLVHDALHDKEATATLLRGFAVGQVDTLEFRAEPGAELPYDEPSIVMSVEQSNTSLVYGDAAILKVFRRLSPGRNPDIEIHDALTRAGCPYIAELLGWIEGRWPREVGTVEATELGSMAMLQRFLVTAADGWDLAKTSVRDLYAEGDLHADEVGGDFAGEARRLGAATAQVHATMRATLATGTLDDAEVGARVEAMRTRLQRALDVVAELRPYAPVLHKTYDALADLGGPVPVQRVHGDFHLGQVVRTVSGWKLLDFEGEPTRPLAERGGLDSPLRDVAGMLRSFDYAARHLLNEHPGGEAQLSYRAGEWSARNRGAFCEGYAEVAGRDPREDEVLLRAYETDKAVYEAVYEAQNRPAWLAIPLAAVERLAT
ncbi:MAG TPA: aminoglycoside phosphotransferase [Actinomycetes bacterium]|nr:aminoglycoside phosphotransferase [Actinomycetes bacterium]